MASPGHRGSGHVAAFEELVHRAHEAADLESFGRTVARGALALIPGISASYNEVNPLARRAFAVIEPEPDEAWWAHYQPVFEAHMHENPVLAHTVQTGDTRARTWDDVGDVERFRTTALYRRFYEPLGIESQLAVLLPAPPGVMIGIAVNRGPEGFTVEDRQLLDALRPHVIHSYRHVQLRAEHRALRDVMADDGWTVVLVHDDGVVASPVDGSPAGIACGRPLPEPLLGSFLETVRRRAPASAPAVASAPVRLASTATNLVAAVVPSAVPPHVVLIRSARPLDPAGLRSLGLTPRQAEVAEALARGLDNRAIADQLAIRPATVKKHLEAVYRALGVTSRAAAVARLTGHTG